MNNSEKESSSTPLENLIFFIKIIALLGLGLSTISFANTLISEKLYDQSLCISNKCLESFYTSYEYSLLTLKATFDTLVAFSTIGGIVVALLSYLNTASTAALSNHIAHYSIFQNYVANEISRRSRVSASSVDNLVWYNYIFSTSRSGKTNVSKEYVKFIKELNELISESNKSAEKAIDGSFRYKPHQEKIIAHLEKSGLELSYLPRNDFFEIEGQIFSLIDRVNQSFCYTQDIPQLTKRKYI